MGRSNRGAGQDRSIQEEESTNDDLEGVGIRCSGQRIAILVGTVLLTLAMQLGDAPNGMESDDPRFLVSPIAIRQEVVLDACAGGQCAAALWILAGAGHAPGGLYMPDLQGEASSIVSLPITREAGTQEMGSRVHATSAGAFLEGYRSAGGQPEYEAHLIDDVIPCEWTGGFDAPWYPGNGYLSWAQFDPGSWVSAGGGDPSDAYTVGRNVANWIRMIDDPGSTSGWPVCWHRGGW